MPGTGTPIGGIQGFVAQLQQIKDRVQNLEVWQRSATAVIQPGVITGWGGSTPPPGALQCNGQTFSPAQYPQLAAALDSDTVPTISGTPMSVIWTGSPVST